MPLNTLLTTQEMLGIRDIRTGDAIAETEGIGSTCAGPCGIPWSNSNVLAVT
jgi:hypothetical protein